MSITPFNTDEIPRSPGIDEPVHWFQILDQALNIQAQVLNCLHDLAWSTNRQVEKRLITDQADTISQQLALHDLTPWLDIDGRTDVPPYLAELLKLVLHRANSGKGVD